MYGGVAAVVADASGAVRTAAGSGRSRAGAASAVTTRPTTATPASVAAGLQPQLRVRAPTRAAKTPPIENAAWNADMTGRR